MLCRFLTRRRLVRCSLACGASTDVDELRPNGVCYLPRGPGPAARCPAGAGDLPRRSRLAQTRRGIPEGELGGQIGYLVRGGCTLAPDAYLFSVIDRAVQAEAGKLPKRQ